MVVMQVLPALESGGVERGTVEMVRAITAAGGTALVASAGGRLVPAVTRAGGRHLTLGLATKDPARMWLNARLLARAIGEHGVQIVHARSRAPAWSAWLAARRAGARFVTTYHGAYGEGMPFKRAYNAVMARGERVIAISQFIAGLVASRHGVGPERLRVVPRGVDPAAFDPATVTAERMRRVAARWDIPDGAPTIVMPARLSRWKGQGVLLDALARLDHPEVFCVFVGEGARKGYESELARRVDALRLGERVRFAGHCEDMPAALMLADVVVHCSVEAEAFGRVVVEAQAMGRPVIASDLGGPRETVVDGETGWRVRPGDADHLALTLRYVLSLPREAREGLGSQARAAVLERFTTARMQQATLAIYREVLPTSPALA